MFTRKGRATRERIIAVAARQIFERGVAGTSMDQVREGAEVSFSQLYHYFKDKMALVRAVIAYQTEMVLEGQRPLLDRLDSMDALREWRNLLVDYQRRTQCRGGCPLGTLSTELSENSSEARADLNAAFAHWEAPIRSGLRAMKERGELRSDADPDSLALATLAAVQGGLLLAQVRRDTKPLEVALDAILALIVSQTKMRRSGG